MSSTPRYLLALLLLTPLTRPTLAADAPMSDPKGSESKDADSKADGTDDKKGDGKKDAEAKEEDQPAPVVTAHSITVDGKVIHYHATTGYLMLKAEEGKPFLKPGAVRRAGGLDDEGAGGKEDSGGGKEENTRTG